MAVSLFCIGAAASIHAADEPPAVLNPASQGYVNTRQCFACHASIFQSYRETGMAKSFARPRPENTVEDYTNKNRFYHAPSGTYFEMIQRGADYFQLRYQIGYEGKRTNVEETKIDYFLGSAIHARAYLHRSTDGRLLQLPVTWYSEKGGYWWMAPGYDTADHVYGQRAITYDCIFCHNGYEAIPASHARLGDEPVYSGDLPEGVDCQRCHGPGRNHIQAASKAGAKPEEIRAAIVNPAKLAPDREAEVCLQCHLQTTEFSLPHVVKRYDRGDFSYRPGQPLGDFELAFDYTPGTERDNWFQNVSTASRLRMSQCFLKSNGALKCTTCHDPHNIRHGEESADHYNAVCRQCHAAKFSALVVANKHTAETGCTGCHMPLRRPVEVVHIIKTDHYIQRAKPSADLRADIPERHETLANSYRGKVELYYPKALSNTPENEMYLAIAQVRDRSNLANGIPRLTAALDALHPKTPEPYFELASAYQSTGQLNLAIAAYREALGLDPRYPAALLGLATALRQSGQLSPAAEAFEQATRAAPDNPKAWNELGQVDLDLDRAPQALEALKKSISLAPEIPQPHNGLGIVLAQSGNFPSAEAEFREAIRILPGYGEAHGNLAGVLDIERDLKQALYEFDLAVRLSPGDANTHFNYGAVLSREKRFDEASTQMQAAVRANPNFAEAHEMLGRCYEQQGQTDDALREYEAAVRINPEMSQAQLDLGAVLAKKGDLVGAAAHLRQASNSNDPRLRQIALQLLEQLTAKP
ncbi:MAG TPA: tetratricopeptide repeat protein [Bryobacteraceae bacterium]|jgi:tetratricopeptide (TPR) repeat protein|nr:tetratricopeptide repeat protein [Bryobacteraceae bacterium]